MESITPLAYIGGLVIAVCALACLTFALRQTNELTRTHKIDYFLQSTLRKSQAAPLSLQSPSKLEKHLSRAGIKISSRIWYGCVIALSAVVFIFLVFRDLFIGAFLGALMVYILSEIIISVRIKRRRRHFDEQLARALPQIAENLRSGLSIEHATKAVARISPEPLASELNQVNAESSFSLNFPAALIRLSNRTGSNDIALLATATRISKEHGGSIAVTIDQVAETVDIRQEMRRHCESATSSTKLSAWVMVTMLLLVFVGLSFLQDGFLSFYLTQPLGWICAGIAVLLVCVGIFSIYQIADISLD